MNGRSIKLLCAVAIALPGLLGVGCAARLPVHPSLALSAVEAERALEEMSEAPRSFQRPVVVLGGIYDPGFAAPTVARRLARLSGPDQRILSVSFFGMPSFEACRKRAVEAVQAAWPSDDPAATIEVDVVGVSMGGLVARYAARTRSEGERRLAIKRLYTIASPHLGANMASIPTLDRRVIDMRPGSAFLTSLNVVTAAEEPELVPYARTGDAIVGEENAAPPGRQAWLVPNLPLTFSHLTASRDPRILADIGRRLRGEEPFTEASGAETAAEGTSERPPAYD